MVFTDIGVVVVVIFIRTVICEQGYVKEIYMNKKFYCEGASKDSFIVNSQIQCIHHCMRKDCRLINYRMKEGGTLNCEVISKTGEYPTVMREDNWMAVIFEVVFVYIGCMR